MPEQPEPVTIVAIKKNPQPWQYGLVYFNESEWPVDGYELVKRVVGCTKSELRHA